MPYSSSSEGSEPLIERSRVEQGLVQMFCALGTERYFLLLDSSKQGDLQGKLERDCFFVLFLPNFQRYYSRF